MIFIGSVLILKKTVSKVEGVSYCNSVDIENENIKIKAYLESNSNYQKISRDIAKTVFKKYLKSGGRELKSIGIELIYGYKLMIFNYHLKEEQFSFFRSEMKSVNSLKD